MAFRRDAFQPGWYREPQRAPRTAAPTQVFEGAPDVSTDARPRYVIRSAGVVAPRTLVSAPQLPRAADFRSATFGRAYWLARAPERTGPGSLFVASGARVLSDLRGELGITTGDPVWSEGILRRLGQLVTAAGARAPTTLPTRGTLPADWLRAALWYTYIRDGYPRQVESVRLPVATELPTLGAPLGTDTAQVAVVDNFDPSTLAVDPFSVFEADEIVIGGPPRDSSSEGSSSGGGLFLAMLAAAALALAGEK